jgi:hypothetical protein
MDQREWDRLTKLIRENFEVSEFRKQGTVYVRIVDRATGRKAERPAGASRSATYRELIEELVGPIGEE